MPENAEQYSSPSWRGQGDGWHPEGPKCKALKHRVVNLMQVREKEKQGFMKSAIDCWVRGLDRGKTGTEHQNKEIIIWLRKLHYF